VFCEVKSKSGTRFGDPLEMVNAEKIRRVRHAAQAWLLRHPECRGLRIRYDVVVVRAGRLQHLARAF
jgi:putative endonuclease